MKIKTLCGSIFFLLFSTAVFAAQPAEWASGIQMTPAQPQEGDRVSFQMTARATENIDHFEVVGVLDQQQVFKRKYAVKATGNRTIRFSWKATNGDHLISFRIIPAGTTTKKDARQITALRKSKDPLQIGKKFTVAAQPAHLSPPPTSQQVQPIQIQQPVCEGRPLPDLVVKSLRVSGSSQPGTAHSISVHVDNQGQCDSGPFSVRLDVTIQVPNENIFQTKEIGKKYLPSLPPCRESSCEESQAVALFDYTLLNNNFAQYDFTAEVDGEDRVEEFNERNNVMERTGTIRVLPDN